MLTRLVTPADTLTLRSILLISIVALMIGLTSIAFVGRSNARAERTSGCEETPITNAQATFLQGDLPGNHNLLTVVGQPLDVDLGYGGRLRYVDAANCAGGEFWISSDVEVILPTFLEIVSIQIKPNMENVTISGNTIRFRARNSRYPLSSIPDDHRTRVQTRFRPGVTEPVSAPISNYSIIDNDHYSTFGSETSGNTGPVALHYTKVDITSPTTGPVGPGDEVEYRVTTREYPHFTTTASKFTIPKVGNVADFVEGSLSGATGTISQTASSVVLDFGANPGTRLIKYRMKVRAAPPTNAVEVIHFPTYNYTVVTDGFNGYEPRTYTKNDATQHRIPLKPNLKMEWLPGGTTVPIGGELPFKVKLTNLSTTTAMTNARLGTRTFQGEGLATFVTPEPQGVALEPGESKEIEYRLLGTRLGKFNISAPGAASSAVGNFATIAQQSPEFCVGCQDVDLIIEPPTKKLKVGDTFPVKVQVTSNMEDPTTVTFGDPVVKEVPPDEVSANAILALEPPARPEPFVLTPDAPSRTFTGVAVVNKLGVTELVSSLTYTKPSNPPQAITSKTKIEVSPFDLTVQVTPRTTSLNRTEDSSKSAQCLVLEAQPNGPKNCIEITATVKNEGTQTITNVRIPDATDPLKLINETNPQLLGEPLEPIGFQHPAGPGPVYPPIDLEPGQEATWTWWLDAYDAPAQLAFEPTVFGVLNGAEIGGSGKKKFTLVKNPILEWGMRPTDGRTSYKSGDLVRADGYIENLTAADGGEGKDLLVYVYAIPKGNAGGGWVVPMDHGEGATQEYFFNLPHEEGVRVKTVKSIFRSLRAGKVTEANISFGVRVWVINDDGSITDADDQAQLNEDGYSDEFDVTYAPEQIIVDPYLQNCLAQDVPPELCGFSEKFYGDFLPGLVGLGEFMVNGLDFLAEGTARSMAIQAKRDQLKLQAVLDDPEAKNALMQSLHADYVVLHQQGVLAGHVAGSLPMALEEFSNQTLDSFGRYMLALENGDLEEIRLRNGQFFGSNPDLALEPLIMLRGITKLRASVASLRQGTADNVYAAAVQTSARRQAADLDARIAAKKAEGGDPDLAKALLPGDRLTEKLLIEVFGVDQDTVRRIQKIANDAGVVLAFRARSARASELLRMNLAWPKPQALKQKCVNKLDIDYLGYDPDSYGRIEIVEPPSNLRGKEGQELSDALDAHMELLVNSQPPKPELQGDAGKELRAEIRERLKVRTEEWSKYTPKLELDNPNRLNVPVDVSFEAPMQWAHDRVTDIGVSETRKIYRNQRSTRIDPATDEPIRRWEITMDGPGGQEARHVTGDIDFLGILDQNGAFINDKDKRMAIYKAMTEAHLMEHGESMSFRLEKARLEYLECCVLGSGEGMLTVGPWGPPRVGFFIDNRSVINDANAAFKRVRQTEVARRPSGEVIYENGRPKTVVIRMEDPTGEFLLYTGSPMLNYIDEAVERVFTPVLWETVWRDHFEAKVKIFFPLFLSRFIEDENSQNFHASGGAAVFSRGGPVVRFEPHAIVELRPHDQLQMWTSEAGWTNATREDVVEAGQPGVVDFAPYSVLRGNHSAGDATLTIASLAEMGATGDFFQEGDWIVLDPGGPKQETALIVGMNPLTLAAPLRLDHQVGEMVTWVAPPTAATATLSGFVRTAEGRGIANVTVVITDQAGVSRWVTTNTFGRFKISDVAVGEQHTLFPKSRRYQFAPQTITVGGDIADIGFVPILIEP